MKSTPSSLRDQLDDKLKGYGLGPKGRARAYQKPYTEYFDSPPYPVGLGYLTLLNSPGSMVEPLMSMWDNSYHNAVSLAIHIFIELGCFLCLYLALHSHGLLRWLLILLPHGCNWRRSSMIISIAVNPSFGFLT